MEESGELDWGGVGIGVRRGGGHVVTEERGGLGKGGDGEGGRYYNGDDDGDEQSLFQAHIAAATNILQ